VGLLFTSYNIYYLIFTLRCWKVDFVASFSFLVSLTAARVTVYTHIMLFT
jgi:hypothetical protein